MFSDKVNRKTVGRILLDSLGVAALTACGGGGKGGGGEGGGGEGGGGEGGGVRSPRRLRGRGSEPAAGGIRQRR